MRNKIVPLIREPHPSDYNGLPFLTLIEYKDTPYITIVDNYLDKVLNVYVIDMCDAEEINKEILLLAGMDWWSNYKNQIPFSFYLSRNNLTDTCYKAFRTFQTEHITRAIGPVPVFKMDGMVSVKRRCKRDISNIPLKKINTP